MKHHGMLRTTLALAALGLLLAASARAGRSDHDEVYPVSEGTRLIVEHTIGTLVIIGWDRDEIHVDAAYDDTQEFEVRDRGLRFMVELLWRHGMSGGYGDVELRIPRWMPVDVTGHEVDVEIEGVEAEIEVEVVGGDVFIVGGREDVRVRSVHGGIEVHDAIADLDLSSAHEDVELRDCTGEVRAETVNGDIRMDGMKSSALDIETTNGDVLVDGDLAADGGYYVSTHAGDIDVSIASDADLTINIDTYHGSVESLLETELEEIREGKRYRMVLGDGRGRLDIESFQGDVRLYDPKVGRRKRG